MNFLADLMYKRRLKGHPDPYKAISNVVDVKSLPAQSQGRVLVVPYRVNSVSNLFEGNVSLILQNRGYAVDALLCGAAISHCDNVDAYITKWPRCKMCVLEQNKFVDAFGVHPVWINEHISKTDETEIETFISSHDLSSISTLEFRGIKLSRPLTSALQLYHKTAEVSYEKLKESFIGFIKTIAKTIIVLDKYFEKKAVDFVLVSHGVYSTWGTVQEYCLAKNIHFVTWGREYNGAGVIAAHNESYLSEPMYEKDSVWDKQQLTAKQRELAVNYLESKVGVKENKLDYVNYHGSTKRILPAAEIREALNIGNATVIGLFPNIPWDGQAFRPNKIFADINNWIFETIESFRGKNNVYLVIRSHPAELHNDGGAGETMSEVIHKHFGSELPENVIILPADSKISSLSVASVSNGCILYGSTVGYETTFIKKPTILASTFFYSNKDISFDPVSKQEYFDLINNAIDGKIGVDDARFERLLQYTFHYQYRRIMPERLVKLHGLFFLGTSSSSQSEYLANKEINKFVDCCLQRDKFYFDEFYD